MTGRGWGDAYAVPILGVLFPCFLTWMALIASATATVLFRQFILTIPDELVEAARFDLSVRFIEQLGADTVVHGAVSGAEVPFAVRLAGVQRHETGTVLPLSYALGNLQLFDADSGRRLEVEVEAR